MSPFSETGVVWKNGRLIPWKDATIHLASHVVHYGSCLFEGLRAYDTPKGTAIFRLRDHTRRLYNSCKIYRMDIPYTEEAFNAAVVACVRANGLKACYIRPLVYRGYGALGVNPFPNPVDCAVLVWEWGNYLGPEAMENGVDVCASSWWRMAPNKTLPCPHLPAHAADLYLRSPDLTFRTRLSLDGQWPFDPAEITNPENASLITVPSPWQADERFRDHTGQAWYQRELEVPGAWLSGDRVVILGFGAVDYFAEVWVNGTKSGEHEGGYLPFELDITSMARPGRNNITVRVDVPMLGGVATFSNIQNFAMNFQTTLGNPNMLFVQDTNDIAGRIGFGDYWFSNTDVDNVVVTTPVVLVNLDVKPGSCPNRLNAKYRPDGGSAGRGGGVVPVAILGTGDLDVTQIDISSLSLAGVTPIRHAYEDVSTPAPGENCDCVAAGPDGNMDLTLKFDHDALVAALGAVPSRQTVSLTLNGLLLDGTAIMGVDCLVIVPERGIGQSVTRKKFPAPNRSTPGTLFW